MNLGTARYFDGKQAVSREVTLFVLGEKLEGKDDSGSVFQWPLNSIRVKHRPKQDESGLISSLQYPNTRLSLNYAVFQKLNVALPNNSFRSFTSSTVAIFSIVLVTLLIVGALVWSVPRFTPSIVDWIPDQIRKNIGEHALAEFELQDHRCDHPKGMKALNKLVQKILPNPKIPVSVNVYSSVYVNAIALPGGHVAIFSELLDTMKHPDELAGVLAHEFGHVQNNDSLDALLVHFGYSFITEVILGDIEEAELLLSLSNHLIELKHSREAEANADVYGLQLLEKANINPNGLQTVFKHLKTLEPSEGDDGWTSFLSTHPPIDARIHNISKESSKKRYPAILSKREWKDLKNICLIHEDK